MTQLAEHIAKSKKKYLKQGKKLSKRLLDSGLSKDEIICAGDYLLEVMTVAELKGEKTSEVAGQRKGKGPANEGGKKTKQRG